MHSPILLPKTVPAPKMPTGSTLCRNGTDHSVRASDRQFHEYAQGELAGDQPIGSAQAPAAQISSQADAHGQQNIQAQPLNEASQGSNHSGQGNSNQANSGGPPSTVVTPGMAAPNAQVESLAALSVTPTLTMAVPNESPSLPQVPQPELLGQIRSDAVHQHSGLVEATGSDQTGLSNRQLDQFIDGTSERQPGHRGGVAGRSQSISAASQYVQDHVVNHPSGSTSVDSTTKSENPVHTSRAVGSSGIVTQLRDRIIQEVNRDSVAQTEVPKKASSKTASTLQPGVQQSTTANTGRTSGFLQVGDHRSEPPAQARAQELELQIRQQRTIQMNASGQRGAVPQGSLPFMADSQQGPLSSGAVTPFVDLSSDGAQLVRGSITTSSVIQNATHDTSATQISNGILLSHESGESNRLSGRLLRGMSAMLNQNGGMMRMRLEPDALGEVRIQMNLNRGHVSVAFESSSAEARAVLQQHLHSLEAALKAQGMTIEQLVVKNGQFGGYQSDQSQEERMGQEQHEAQQDHQDQDSDHSEKRSDRDHFAPLLDLFDSEVAASDEHLEQSMEAM